MNGILGPKSKPRSWSCRRSHFIFALYSITISLYFLRSLGIKESRKISTSYYKSCGKLRYDAKSEIFMNGISEGRAISKFKTLSVLEAADDRSSWDTLKHLVAVVEEFPF